MWADGEGADAKGAVAIERRVAGQGATRAVLRTEVRNLWDDDAELVVRDALPWWVLPFFSDAASSPEWRVVAPGAVRGRPTVAEATLRLAPGETHTLSLAIDRAMMHTSEFPPDANRGMDLPGVEVWVRGLRVVGPPAVLRMPLPDFSIVYNVVTVTCSIMAIFAGSVLNAFTRA